MNVVHNLYADPRQLLAMDPAIDLNNEGMQLMRAGKYAEAHKALTESLKIKQQVVGRNSRQCALSLMNIGDNYLLWGKLDEAEAAGQEALRIRTSMNDPEARYSRELLDDVKKARLALAEKKARQAATASAASSSGSSKEAGGRAQKCKKCGKEGSTKRKAAGESRVAFLQKCSGCHDATYCSKDCQKEDWKDHKAECKAARSAAAAE